VASVFTLNCCEMEMHQTLNRALDLFNKSELTSGSLGQLLRWQISADGLLLNKGGASI
jgi:hypothetical protein